MNISFYSYNSTGEFIFQGEGVIAASPSLVAIAAQVNLDKAPHVEWVRFQAPGFDAWFSRDTEGKAIRLSA